MKQAVVELKSISPYSQSKHYEEPKLQGESHSDFEERTWRMRMHTAPDGRVMIPPMAFVNAWRESARRQAIKRKGQSTFTKNFEAGLLVLEPLQLKVKADGVPCDRLFVPSDGKRGGGSRVTKYFPRIDDWAGRVTFHVIDDEIVKPVFEQVAGYAGQLVGIGRFRPEKGGFYGRFEAKLVDWKDMR